MLFRAVSYFTLTIAPWKRLNGWHRPHWTGDTLSSVHPIRESQSVSHTRWMDVDLELRALHTGPQITHFLHRGTLQPSQNIAEMQGAPWLRDLGFEYEKIKLFRGIDKAKFMPGAFVGRQGSAGTFQFS